MQYQELGTSGIRVSRIAFGAWGLGGGNVWSDRTLSAEQVGELLDAAYDLGINYIDTAPVYGVGESERILGEALKGRRNRFVVQTKCSLNWRGEGGRFEYERDGFTVNRDHRPEAVRKDVEESLVRMQLDHLDSVVVHRISETVPVSETMGELMRMKEEGKIRAVLISNSEPEDLDRYAACGPVAGVQEKFSLLSSEKRSYFDTCRRHGAVFQTYGSLEEGLLCSPDNVRKTYGPGDIRTNSRWVREPHRTGLLQLFERLDGLREKYGCSYANLVQAWTLAQYEGINLLTGFRRRETMEDTCRALELHLDGEDLDSAADYTGQRGRS